jgi:hypothetical protein
MTLEFIIKKCQESPIVPLSRVIDNKYYCCLSVEHRDCKFQGSKYEITIETQFKDRKVIVYQCNKRYYNDR